MYEVNSTSDLDWLSRTPEDVWMVRRRLRASGYWPLAVYGPEAKVTAPGKQPASKGWQVRSFDSEPPAVREPPLEKALNTGILCDGMRAIDIDIDCPQTAQKVTALVRTILGGAPIRYRSDSARCLMLFRATTGEPGKRSISGERGRIEVLGRGQQFVAFGIHSDGYPYQWEPSDFGAYNRTQLNEVTEEQISEFLQAAAPTIGASSPSDRIFLEATQDQDANHGVTDQERAYATKALKDNAIELGNKLPGSGRNTALNGTAFRMGRMVGAGWIEQGEVERALIAASKQNGYESKDGIGATTKTLRSGLLNGIASPHPPLPETEIPESLRNFIEEGHQRFSSSTPKDAVAEPTLSSSIKTGSDLIIRRVADVAAEPIRWLWPNRIALGKVTLIAGDPGLGKSQLTAYLAARVSTGGLWPNADGPSPTGAVIMLSCEDDVADTIRPRLEAVRANINVVHVIEAVKTGDGQSRGFNITADLAKLEAAIKSIPNVRLVTVDPITAYLGGTDTHRTSDVRAALGPLQVLAAQYGVAVVAVSHLNKASGGGKSINAVTGSGAFVAAARASFLVVKDDADENRRLLIESKNNLGRAPGLSYRIKQTRLASGIVAPFVEFEIGTVCTTADEALSASNLPTRGGALREAEIFLLAELSSGEVPAQEIERQASQQGISITTLRRASKKIGVQKVKSGFSDGWIWRLEASSKVIKRTQDDQENDMGTFANPWSSSTEN